MTKTSDQEVIQADREAAADCARYFEHNFTACEIMAEEADCCTLVQIVAAHRMTERAAIVAWLRAYPKVIGLDEMTAWNVAAHIERGDHTENSHEQ